nr:hypothetical protein CFP56_62126 [Quercus suber]
MMDSLRTECFIVSGGMGVMNVKDYRWQTVSKGLKPGKDETCNDSAGVTGMQSRRVTGRKELFTRRIRNVNAGKKRVKVSRAAVEVTTVHGLQTTGEVEVEWSKVETVRHCECIMSIAACKRMDCQPSARVGQVSPRPDDDDDDDDDDDIVPLHSSRYLMETEVQCSRCPVKLPVGRIATIRPMHIRAYRVVFRIGPSCAMTVGRLASDSTDLELYCGGYFSQPPSSSFSSSGRPSEGRLMTLLTGGVAAVCSTKHHHWLHTISVAICGAATETPQATADFDEAHGAIRVAPRQRCRLRHFPVCATFEQRGNRRKSYETVHRRA